MKSKRYQADGKSFRYQQNTSASSSSDQSNQQLHHIQEKKQKDQSQKVSTFASNSYQHFQTNDFLNKSTPKQASTQQQINGNRRRNESNSSDNEYLINEDYMDQGILFSMKNIEVQQRFRNSIYFKGPSINDKQISEKFNQRKSIRETHQKLDHPISSLDNFKLKVQDIEENINASPLEKSQKTDEKPFFFSTNLMNKREFKSYFDDTQGDHIDSSLEISNDKPKIKSNKKQSEDHKRIKSFEKGVSQSEDIFEGSSIDPLRDKLPKKHSTGSSLILAGGFALSVHSPRENTSDKIEYDAEKSTITYHNYQIDGEGEEGGGEKFNSQLKFENSKLSNHFTRDQTQSIYQQKEMKSDLAQDLSKPIHKDDSSCNQIIKLPKTAHFICEEETRNETNQNPNSIMQIPTNVCSSFSNWNMVGAQQINGTCSNSILQNSNRTANFKGSFHQDSIHQEQNSEFSNNNISTFLRHYETEDIKIMQFTPRNEDDQVNLKNYTKIYPYLLNALFSNDFIELKKHIYSIFKKERNIVDVLGNTLLFIATKLTIKNSLFFKSFKVLLQSGADPCIRNINGFSPLDQAIQARDVKTTTTLFEYIYQTKLNKINDSMLSLSSLLISLPDFYIEIKWKFESVIPFLGYLAPSDNFRFWKIGDSFRLDTTLVGVTNLKCKRRNMSLIFQNNKLHLLNKSNQTVTNPSEPLDLEEKKAIIQDLLESKPFLSTLEVVSCSVSRPTSWIGNIYKKKYGNYIATKYQMKIGYEYHTRNILLLNSNDQDFKSCNAYLESLKPQSISFNSQTEPNQKNKSNKQKEKQTICSIWMSNDYPLTFQQFLPVLEVLERSNPMLSKLNEFLKKQEVNNLLIKEGFPVKVQIPFNYTLKSTVDFSDFKYHIYSLKNLTPQQKQEILFIDPSFKSIPRKIAQKILTRSKKRMVVANMITA